MDNKRHHDAVLAHLLQQVEIRTHDVVFEECQRQQESFNNWSVAAQKTIEKLQEQGALAQSRVHDLEARFDTQSRYIKHIEQCINDRDGADWLNEIQRRFAAMELVHGRTPAPLAELDALVLPVEPTPEDANHRG